MATTKSTTVNPLTRDRLHDEYGPAPWWSEPHLRALLEDEDLTARGIARYWNVSAETVRMRAREHGIREGSA